MLRVIHRSNSQQKFPDPPHLWDQWICRWPCHLSLQWQLEQPEPTATEQCYRHPLLIVISSQLINWQNRRNIRRKYKRQTGLQSGTRNSSGDEIANVNFFTTTCSTTFTQCTPESYWIQWNNAKQGLLRRSRSFKVTDFGTNQKLIYDFLLVINTNIPPILDFDRSTIATPGYPLAFKPSGGGVPLGRSP